MVQSVLFHQFITLFKIGPICNTSGIKGELILCQKKLQIKTCYKTAELWLKVGARGV